MSTSLNGGVRGFNFSLEFYKMFFCDISMSKLDKLLNEYCMW